MVYHVIDSQSRFDVQIGEESKEDIAMGFKFL